MILRWGIALLGGLALLLYIVYAAAMIAVHPIYIYPFDQTVFDNPRFPAAEIAGVPVYVHQGAPDAPVVVYFMGNVGAMHLFAPMLEHHAERGRSVVAMGYRGAGGLPGESSETSLKADARTVVAGLDAVLTGARGPVIAQGYSLGTGLAVHVAANSDVIDGVILAAPYARLCELMAAASGLPACLLPGIQKWQTLREAKEVTAPVLILHGENDTLVPLAQGRKLAAALAASGETVAFKEVAGAGHVDLFGRAGYLAPLDAFIEATQDDY